MLDQMAARIPPWDLPAAPPAKPDLGHAIVSLHEDFYVALSRVKALKEKTTKDDAKIAEQANTIASNEAKIAELEKQNRENSQKAEMYDKFVAAQEQGAAKRARAE